MIAIGLSKDQWEYLLRLLAEQKYRDSAALIETIARGLMAAMGPNETATATAAPADAAAA